MVVAGSGPVWKSHFDWMENSRSEAKYQGERALFLLLMTTARINQ
jgi:hypothetical protein